MMVLEIELQHAESFHTFVLIQIPEFMPHSQDELLLDQLFKYIYIYQFLGTCGIEIQSPSTTTPNRTSSVVICRGKNRYVDELHLRDPGHNPTSSELHLVKSVAEESEPCSTEMEQSRIEEIHATQCEIQTNPVYHSKEVILVGERKWNDILAHKSFKGDCLQAEISKLVMRLVRRYDQDERETEGAVHWNSMGPKTAESISEAGRAKNIGHGLASTHL